MSAGFSKLLEVDLSAGQTGRTDIDPELAREYMGGSSLGARLFLDGPGLQAGPLDAETQLLVMTGPLVGTDFPGSSRFSMCGRSPLTGIWGESASGGAFGSSLRRAGWDGIRFSGRAERPVYLLIEDDRVSLEDASPLWGLDTYEVIDRLREKHPGKRKVRVLSIGPAGENLVKYASVCNDKAHHFGRTGLGAVMGSKNVKALVVRGTGQVSPAEEAAYKEARQNSLALIKESMISDSFNELGTAAAMDLGAFLGDVPMRNWALGEDDDMASALGGPAMAETILRGRAACQSCPIGCKPVVEVETPAYRVTRGPGPEYETCGAFGTMLMNNNLEAVALANELCNRLGLDTITCGGTMAFIMEAFEKGLLTTADTDGLDLSWGSIDAVLELLPRIARREGFGDRAADGSAALARRLGPASEEFLVTVKDLELPMHDPRGFHGQGLSYMMSNRGACHLQHSDQAVEQGMVCWPELGLEEDYPAQESAGKGRMVMITENVGQMANAVCVCHFVHWAMGNEALLAGVNAVTGYGLSLEDYLQIGRRSWVLKRAINNSWGVTAADDRLPPRVLTPLSEGGAEGSSPDEALMKEEYYRERGLNEEGRPTPELFAAVGLDALQEKLN